MEPPSEPAEHVMGVKAVMERLSIHDSGLAERALAVAKGGRAVAHLRGAGEASEAAAATAGVPEEAARESEVEALVEELNSAAAATKAELLFKMFDLKGDGVLDAEELSQVLKMSAAHSKVALSDAQVQHAVWAMLASVRGPQEEAHGAEDAKGSGAHTLEQFRRLLEQHPGMMSVRLPPKQPADDNDQAHWWSAAWARARRPVAKLASRVHQALTTQYGLFVLFLCAILAGNWAWGFVVHVGTFEFYAMGWAWPIARACAYTVRAATGLILLTVSYRMLTNLRSTWFRYLIPFDHLLQVHMMLGMVFFVCGSTHAISHFFAKYNAASPASAQLYAEAGLPQPTLEQLYVNWPTFSGFLLLFTIITLYLFAVRFIKNIKVLQGTLVGRVLNNFNYFHASHQVMWVTLIVLLLIHPLPDKPGVPHTSRMYLFIGIPLIIFLSERAYRLWVRGQEVEVVSIQAMTAEANRGSAAAPTSGCHARGPGGVTQLILRVGARFRAQQKPGQYLYVNIEGVANEWHPFTITSAPEDEFVTVHVATKGDWTRKLFALASSLQSSGHVLPPAEAVAASRKRRRSSVMYTNALALDRHSSDSGIPTQPMRLSPSDDALSSTLAKVERGGHGGDNDVAKDAKRTPHVSLSVHPTSLQIALPRIRVDGPYGAPAQRFMDYDVLVLIAGGIGVTPMVSILRHLVHQLGARRCMHCSKVSLNEDFWLSKLYFHWIVREQGALQWFGQTLQDITALDACNLCDVRIHYTPAGRPGLGNLMLRLAQEVEREQNNLCLLSGSEASAKTSFGRPDVNAIISAAAVAHPDAKVGVMYCGAEELGAQLQKAIKKCGHPRMNLHREVF